MTYRLFGAETSAYSTKMRSYLTYKSFAFDWVPRTQESESELKRLSRFATLPVLVTESGYAVHDTTPLIEALEADRPEPSATPADPALAFLACVLEEYADTWLAKGVFHYRWSRKKDQKIAAQRAIDEYYVTSQPDDRKASEDRAIETMTGQLKLMQVDGDLGDVVEKSFKKFVKLLDDHLRKHLFIFGDRPSIADFAIAGQLIQMLKDPTPAKIIEKDGEFVAKWCEFMTAPTASGPFAAFDDLKETLAPIFAEDLAAFFLPWAAENLESSLAGAETFSLAIGKEPMTLAPLRSAARSFRELRRKFVSGQTIEELKAFTDAAGATVYLLRPQRQEQPQPAPAVSDDVGEGEPAAAAGEAEGQSAPREEGEGGGRKRRRRRRGGRGRGDGAAGAEASGAGEESGEAEDAGDDVEALEAAADDGAATPDDLPVADDAAGDSADGAASEGDTPPEERS
jgi:glutathione S-transferase